MLNARKAPRVADLNACNPEGSMCCKRRSCTQCSKGPRVADLAGNFFLVLTYSLLKGLAP